LVYVFLWTWTNLLVLSSFIGTSGNMIKAISTIFTSFLQFIYEMLSQTPKTNSKNPIFYKSTFCKSKNTNRLNFLWWLRISFSFWLNQKIRSRYGQEKVNSYSAFKFGHAHSMCYMYFIETMVTFLRKYLQL